jgi:hypothetical protein
MSMPGTRNEFIPAKTPVPQLTHRFTEALEYARTLHTETRQGTCVPYLIRAHFQADYHPHADALLRLYRHAVVQNLFEVSITPGNEAISAAAGTVSFGLLNLFQALQFAAADFPEAISELSLRARSRRCFAFRSCQCRLSDDSSERCFLGDSIGSAKGGQVEFRRSTHRYSRRTPPSRSARHAPRAEAGRLVQSRRIRQQACMVNSVGIISLAAHGE